MAVVKADAYGHGAVQVARRLQDKCAFFCVSSILEAMELRQAGLTKPILLLGYTPADAYPTAIREGIRPTIFRLEDALALSQAAQAAQLPARFHFAVDTGMSRIGFQVSEEDADTCAEIAGLPGLYAEGLFSHFATADCADLTRAKHQAERFAAFDEMSSALSELEGYVFANTLLPNIKHPRIVERSCIPVRFSADNYKLNIIKVLFDVNPFKQGLCCDTFMLYRQVFKYQ